MERVKKAIKRHLTHLQATERDEAITMLILVGLKHYSLLYPEHNLQMPYLKFLADKYVGEFNVDAHEWQQERSSLKRLERNQILFAERARRFRPDSMAHYPFADEFGSMQDVLAGQIQEEPIDLENMGIPGRIRLITKVFNEMRFNRNGIRLSDLPEALESVGIIISAALRRTLERTRSKQVDGPLLGLDQQQQQGEEAYLEYMEKHIPLSLWKTIVKNFLILRRRGINPSELREVVPGFAARDHRGGPHSRRWEESEEFWDRHEGQETAQDETEWDEEQEQVAEVKKDMDEEVEEDGRGQEESKRVHSAPSHYRVPSPPDQSHKTSRKASAAHSRRHMQNGGKGNTVPAYERRAQEYFHRLKKVPSRLGGVIQQDRGNFQRSQRRTDNAALTSLARRRVDILMNSSPALGFRDPNYFHEPDFASRKSSSSQQRNSKRYQDLESGTATLEIADTFLKGAVGKELMTLPSSKDEDFLLDEEIEDLSPIEAQRRAAQMLGIASRDNTVQRRQAASAPSIGLGFRTLREKATERELDEESKRLYKASGWKSARGGWAADFGPSHTQTLYTGPERYHAFMHDRKMPREYENGSRGKDRDEAKLGTKILEDEMLFTLAKDVYSEDNSNRLRRQDSSRSTVAFTAPIDQKQVLLPSSSPSGRHIGGVASDSGSSGSLDAGVVGAGLDGEFGEDFGDADELLGRLQKSLSLKSASGRD